MSANSSHLLAPPTADPEWSREFNKTTATTICIFYALVLLISIKNIYIILLKEGRKVVGLFLYHNTLAVNLFSCIASLFGMVFAANYNGGNYFDHCFAYISDNLCVAFIMIIL
jgi:hypothetical protein